MSADRWPFGPLRMFGYDFIMADPPWLFETRSAAGKRKSPERHYRCMTLDAIKTLPVDQLARGDCLLWLWATHPMLPQALDVMAAWRCRFVTSGVWVKRTARGKLGFGTGYRLRSASEPFLLGTFGNPATLPVVRTAIEGPRRDHSEKPDEAYAAAERMMPMAFRADLFSKRTRSGWDAWGDETGAHDHKYTDNQLTEEKEKAA